MKIIKIDDPQEKNQICEKILRSLPQWFGIESAILDYIKDVQGLFDVIIFKVKCHYSLLEIRF